MLGKEWPEWLPEGWTATSKKRRDGRRADWTYIDSSTGSRLYSKAAVFRYLESGGLHTPSPNKERRIIVYSGADTSSSQRQSVDNKFNNNTEYSSSRLPDGWIKEFKLRKAGSKVKKEPYYVDPVSGYTFRSRKDALRYIAAGNVNACVIKPKKADNSSKFSIENVGSIVKQPDGQVTRKKSSSGAMKRKIVKQRDGQVTRKKSSSGAIKLKPTLRVGGPEDSPKWLPSGWITEIRTQQSGRCAGHTTKCFFDPVTKTRFHSKRTVLEYLGSVENHTPLAIKETSTETKSAGDICSPLTNKETSMETKSAGDIGSPLTNKVTSMETESAGNICSPLINTVTSMVMESAGDICTSSNQIGSANNKFTSNTSSSSYELPDGWIKEVRPRQSNCGVKKDPYYIDPVSGYEFRSRRDAWRYIESGDVRMCINRPRKRSRSDIYSMEMEDPPPSNLVHMRKETEIQPSHGEGIFLEPAREKTLHETEVNTSPGKKLVVIRKSNNSSSRVRRKGRKKLSEKKQVDPQRQGSAAQLRPKKTKPFKTIPPPTRSSQRLAAALKNKQVVDSGISNPPEGPASMAMVDIDFLRKLEVEGPPLVVEETKASGDRPDDIQNQESAAQLCPGETKSFEGITQPDRSLEQLPLTEADHVVDAGISDTPSQTMPSMPEILPVTPEQGTVQSSEKADEQKAAPTVNQDVQEGTLQSSGKAAEEQMILPQGIGPVTPVQDAFESSKKAAAAAVPAVDQYFSVKLEVQGAVQSSEKADEQKAAPTVNQDEQEGTLQSSGKAAEEQMTLPQGTGPVTPAQDAFESSEKAAAAAAVPAAGQYFSVKLEVQEQPQTVETKPSFDTPDSPLVYPFGDSWPDPCLEFAFRTLTGDIPMLDDTASIENYFQQQVIQSPSLVPKPRVHHPTQQGSSGAQANGLQSGHGV